MDKKNRHSTEGLRRWVSGDLTAKEERQLDAAAAQDKVLGDALSGYRAHAEADHAAHLRRIRQQLPGNEGAKVKRMVWYRVAAAIALLLVAGWWVLNTSDSAPTGAAELAVNDVAPPIESQAPSPPPPPKLESLPDEERAMSDLSVESRLAKEDTNDAQVDKLAADQLATREEAYSAEDVASNGVQLEIADSLTYANADVLAAAEELSVQDSEPDIPVVAPTAPPIAKDEPAARVTYGPNVPTGASQVMTNSGQVVTAQGYRILEGIVMDDTGEPLIGVSVLLKDGSSGVVTDVDGNFSIVVPEENAVLQLSYTGFNSKEILVGNNQDLEVVMDPDTVLDEVVVTGYGTQKRRSDVNATASPSGGFRNLRKYIDDNKPTGVARSRVRLKFQVDATGRPFGFSVLNSNNPDANELAIELIENGPIWTITQGAAPVEVVYVVRL